MDTVKRAAALLDRAEPGWENLIDTGTLNLCSAVNCILGQIYGSYFIGMKVLDEVDYDANSETYVTEWGCTSAWSGGPAHDEWLNQIASRREAQQMSFKIDYYAKELVAA